MQTEKQVTCKQVRAALFTIYQAHYQGVVVNDHIPDTLYFLARDISTSMAKAHLGDVYAYVDNDTLPSCLS